MVIVMVSFLFLYSVIGIWLNALCLRSIVNIRGICILPSPMNRAILKPFRYLWLNIYLPRGLADPKYYSISGLVWPTSACLFWGQHVSETTFHQKNTTTSLVCVMWSLSSLLNLSLLSTPDLLWLDDANYPLGIQSKSWCHCLLTSWDRNVVTPQR